MMRYALDTLLISWANSSKLSLRRPGGLGLVVMVFSLKGWLSVSMNLILPGAHNRGPGNLPSRAEGGLSGYFRLNAGYETERDTEGRRAVVRNGYQPEREVLKGVGPVGVRVSKTRDRGGRGRPKPQRSVTHA